MAYQTKIFSLVSRFLEYPDKKWLLQIPELKVEANNLADLNARDKCMGFINYIETNNLIHLQEEYTRLFDFAPSTALNLTFHRFGQSESRGGALCWFNEFYKEQGLEPAHGELPDFFPMLLEFFSIYPEKARPIMSEYKSEVQKICSNLKKENSIYGELIELAFSEALTDWMK